VATRKQSNYITRIFLRLQNPVPKPKSLGFRQNSRKSLVEFADYSDGSDWVEFNGCLRSYSKQPNLSKQGSRNGNDHASLTYSIADVGTLGCRVVGSCGLSCRRFSRLVFAAARPDRDGTPA
jgi:hypothetical protein